MWPTNDGISIQMFLRRKKVPYLWSKPDQGKERKKRKHLYPQSFGFCPLVGPQGSQLLEDSFQHRRWHHLNPTGRQLSGLRTWLSSSASHCPCCFPGVAYRTASRLPGELTISAGPGTPPGTGLSPSPLPTGLPGVSCCGDMGPHGAPLFVLKFTLWEH